MATSKSTVARSAPGAKIIVLDLPEPERNLRSNAQTPPITTHSERLGGTPTIAGSRLPVVTFLDHLLEGYNVEQFAEEFEVEKGDLEAVLLRIREALEEGWLAEKVG